MLACLLVASAACSSGPPPPVAQRPYAEEAQAKRAIKDDYLRTSKDSPIPVDERAAFAGLPYFPVDPAYRVPASLREDRSGPPVIISLETSTHGIERMQRVGTLNFSMAGAGYSLSAFAGEEGLARLFVPFHDLTNRVETYGGGRYMNLDRTATGVYDLDFNSAYHPVLRLQQVVRVSDPAAREPAGRCDSRRGAAARRLRQVAPGARGTERKRVQRAWRGAGDPPS